MRNQFIELIPADLTLAGQVTEYYKRNRTFLEKYEPIRDDEFFSLEYQKNILAQEIHDFQEKTSFRFYIRLTGQPQIIIGAIGLNNVIWGAFRSAFLGYKLDEKFISKGYMTMAVDMIVKYAFENLGLHRIEANVMPRNIASLKVLEKNKFVNEGLSRSYLKINGVWEDHLRMAKIAPS